MAYLIKGAHVYNPDDLGVQDVLVINDKIAAVGKDLTVVLPELETVDASDKILTPGFIDQHIHVTGGGGEGGPRSRTPEIVLSELISCGTTSLVGVSGTDSVTRSLPNLLAKVQALTEEGVTAWMYTSNYSYPPTTLTGSVKNDLLMVHEVLGVKIALGDHRSSFPTTQNVLDLLTQIRVGGMIAGKIGVLGDSAGGYLAQMSGATNGEKQFDEGDFLNQSSDVQAVVSLYGLSDLRNVGEGFPEEVRVVHDSPAVTEALLVNGPAFNTFPGESITKDPKKMLDASPLGHVDGNEPPFLLFHGSADPLVSPEQSASMYRALKAKNQDAKYILVEGAKHGDLAWYQPNIINTVVNFFKEKLGDPAKIAESKQVKGGNL